MNDFPRIRLELDGMRHSIVHALSNHNREIETNIDAQLKAAVESFNYKAVVDAAVHEAIDAGIKNYFRYGKGAEAIAKAVNEALGEIEEGRGSD